MTDFLSPETRSRVMARIRSKDTKPELALRRALWASGVRGWRCHVKALPGKPDLAFTRWRIAVFVDSVFFHGHPDHFTYGKSGAYWDTKITRNKERDQLANEALTESGWQVLRIWDLDVKKDPEGCAKQVADLVQAARDRNTKSTSNRACARAA